LISIQWSCNSYLFTEFGFDDGWLSFSKTLHYFSMTLLDTVPGSLLLDALRMSFARLNNLILTKMAPMSANGKNVSYGVTSWLETVCK